MKPNLVCKIDEVLKEKGITQRELALMIGMSESVISKLKNNTSTVINKRLATKIIIALDLKGLDDLFYLKF